MGFTPSRQDRNVTSYSSITGFATDKTLRIPEVKEEYCIGCGACEYACPTKPYKSIYVEGNPIHKVAKKPEEKELEKEVDYKEDFPF